LGTVVAGFLADRYGRHKRIMILCALAGTPILLLVSQVATLWALAALTACAWCVSGMGVTLVTIEGGLMADPRHRGGVLGFLAVAGPLGSIVGGFGVGGLADAVGYTRMWIFLGLAYLLCPAFALFLKDAPAGVPAPERPARGSGVHWTLPFLLLILCGILGASGSFLGGLGRSFAMQSKFDAASITSTVAVSGIVALPFTLMVGWMSDRRGRVPLMSLCYAAGSIGLLVYSAAESLISFWVAASLVAFISYVASGVGSALVVDLVDRPAVGRGLAYFGATGWIGAILAFGGGGVAFSRFGLRMGFVLGAGLVVAGLVLLVVIAAVRRKPARKE
jgi:MFS family permease